jgi:hypothetical protein
MSIASYGKQISINVVTDDSVFEETTFDSVEASQASRESAHQNQSRRPATDPIILSLPVSDDLEHRHSLMQEKTLEERLTDYDPDISQTIPSAMLSSIGTLKGAEYSETKSYRNAFERCNGCVSEQIPCEVCIDRYNSQRQTSFTSYAQKREKDTNDFSLPDTTSYVNEQIRDKPIDPTRFRALQYEPSTDQSEFNEGDSNIPLPFESLGTDMIPESLSSSNANHLSENQRLREEIHRLTGLLAEADEKLLQSQSNGTLTRTDTELDRESFEQSEEHRAVNQNECMWHLGLFATEAVGLPITFDELTQTFDCIGCFCSLECAYAYRLEHRSAEAAPIRLLHLAHSIRERESENEQTTELVPAPPRQALIRFKGTMSLDVFLNKTHPWYSVSHSPFRTIPSTIDSSETDTGMYRSMSAAPTTKTLPDQLVRKREKSHPNAQNQWHSSIQRSRLRRKD